MPLLIQYSSYSSLLHSLSYNELGDEAGKAIGNALKFNTSIKEIYLGGNKLGDEAGKAIGNALKVNTSIRLIA